MRALTLIVLLGGAAVAWAGPARAEALDAGTPPAAAEVPASVEAGSPSEGAAPADAGTPLGAEGPPPASGRAPPPPRLQGRPDDPLDVLYRASLDLSAGSVPQVTVRLMEGQSRVVLRGVDGPLLARPRAARGEPELRVQRPEGAPVVLTLRDHRPGEVRQWPVLAEAPPPEADRLRETAAEWDARGVRTRIVTVGSVFGLEGRVLDVRRMRLLMDGPGTEAWLAEASRRAEGVLGHAPVLHERRVRRPTGRIRIESSDGVRLAEGRDLVTLEPDGGHLRVDQVEHGVGYRWHGREDRSYDGTLHVVVDDRGLSVVNAIPLETLVRGLVPAETFASAPAAALRAQAVTARGEVLAKIGTRHLADPTLLCASQHCAVYKGRSAQVATTDAAVADTEGEVLIGPDGALVDAVYSAVCGGHTENNEVVWNTPRDPALRGRADFPATGEWARFAAGIGDGVLRDWLASEPPAWCRLSSMGATGRFRWTRTFSAEEIDGLTARLGVGAVQDLVVKGRGVSGRVRALEVVGTAGRTTIHRELAVRRLFDNLHSGMFVIDVERDDAGAPLRFTFRGGGWGHGVGMCQVGAIGMAEHGRDYRDILHHYYNGGRVVRIYGEPDGSQASQ